MIWKHFWHNIFRASGWSFDLFRMCLKELKCPTSLDQIFPWVSKLHMMVKDSYFRWIHCSCCCSVYIFSTGGPRVRNHNRHNPWACVCASSFVCHFLLCVCLPCFRRVRRRKRWLIICDCARSGQLFVLVCGVVFFVATSFWTCSLWRVLRIRLLRDVRVPLPPWG